MALLVINCCRKRTLLLLCKSESVTQNGVKVDQVIPLPLEQLTGYS